jgi:uncharacterized membrane protein
MMETLRKFLRRVVAGLAIGAILVCTPAAAHKEHKKKHPEAAQIVPAPAHSSKSTERASNPAAMQAQTGEELEGPDEDRSQMTTFERLLDWLGRLHPTIVHFPIAFFPAALFAAIVGRRRPAFAAPVQFLVMAGAVIAPIAAILGWLDAMAADPDPLLTVHRWLGTAVGAAALGIGIWTWRQPERVRSTGMIIALSVITAAVIIQGWYGGAMVHGIDHLNW